MLTFVPDLSTFNIYLGTIVHNVGYPKTFIDEIDKTVGFWPAEPDFFNLERALIDEATYMEQLERLADYLNDAMLFAIKNYDFDLLMGYQVQTDEAGHEFTLVDPRQQSFQDSAKRQRYAEYLERSYQIADRNLKEIIEAAKLWKTNIIAVSDHGMAADAHPGVSEPHPSGGRIAVRDEHGRCCRTGKEHDERRDSWRGCQYLHQSARTRAHGNCPLGAI